MAAPRPPRPGLQSLAVIFLFQAAVIQQLAEAERPGAEAVFAIEEPGAFASPGARRYERIPALLGQKLMTTHSPYFVHHVPLRDLRLVCVWRLTQVTSLPRHIVSDLPWNASIEGYQSPWPTSLFRDAAQNRQVAARCWFDMGLAGRLLRCYRRDPDLRA